MLCLTARFEGRSLTFPVERDEVSIGSERPCDIVLPFLVVSRRHATLRREPDGSRLLIDERSKNGVYKDGRRVTRTRVSLGQPVFLGPVRLVLEEGQTSDLRPAPGLEIADGAADAAASAGRHATASASGPATVTREADAVCLMRALARCEELEPSLLARAAAVLGAESLLAAQVVDEEVRVVALHGRRREGIERLLTARSRGRSIEEGRALIVSTSGEGGRLVAVFPEGTTPERWCTEVCDELADRVVPPRVVPPRVVPPRRQGGDSAEIAARPSADARRADRGLRIPEGMVVLDVGPTKELFELLRRVVVRNDSVLLRGESGTGKELVARLIHDSSPRSQGPFVAVNCSAIPADLLEADLFGVTRGAATGVEARPGHFVHASSGTLLLDEIGDLPEALQPKLLRVLQERQVLPVGSSVPRTVDVRIVAATNKDLWAESEKGSFRRDLYFRLCELEVTLPPLRERPAEIGPLAIEFLRRVGRETGDAFTGVTPDALETLESYGWPGNVRELRSCVRWAALSCAGGPLRAEHLRPILSRRRPAGATESARSGVPPEARPLEGPSLDGPVPVLTLEQAERVAIVNALTASGGERKRAAVLLGISRSGLLKMMKRLAIESSP